MKTISDHLSPYRAFLSGEKQRVALLPSGLTTKTHLPPVF